MTDLYRKKQGLEGVPVNSAEVVGFDVARGRQRCRRADRGLDAVAATLALAIFGGSIVLGIVGGIGLAVVVLWTTTKWRGAARRASNDASVRHRRGKRVASMPEEFEGDLAGAVFWGADLRGARFRDVDLTDAKISHALARQRRHRRTGRHGRDQRRRRHGLRQRA